MHVPVLVVGAGPVGLALAGDLGWRGRSCLLVERGDGSIMQPKMDLVGVRTMEFCRRWGIVDWVETSPYPRDYRQDYVWVTSLTGFELGREPFPSMQETAPPPQSPQHKERCPQDMFDPILRRFVAARPEASVRYETELVSLDESEDGVRAVLRDLRTGNTEVVTADYVVGCDGAGSTVRSALGSTLSGQPALTYTTNVIFRSSELPSLHDKGRAYRFICIGQEGTYATLVAINGGDRWRLSHIGNEQERTLTPAKIDELIVRVVGRPFDYEVLSVVPWTRRELIADTFASRRVFIAGDAAHMMSPTGGFGMNTGIGDAVDLSWKLDGVLQGWGGPGLLRSYEHERRPVATRNVREATLNLDRMLSPRTHRPPAEVFEAGQAGDEARASYGAWFTETMRPEWFSIGIHLGYEYDDSPICVYDGSEIRSNAVDNYEQSTRPGARAPHVWLASGQSTLDLFGRGFALLRLGTDAPTGSGIVAAARRAGVPIAVHAIDEADVVKVYGWPLVLVRPDGHVAWRGNEEPADVEALLGTVTGRAPQSPRKDG